jgi:hypothetical protein
MSRRYTLPQVRELLASRDDSRLPVHSPSQRELVAASLLAYPGTRSKR